MPRANAKSCKRWQAILAVPTSSAVFKHPWGIYTDDIPRYSIQTAIQDKKPATLPQSEDIAPSEFSSKVSPYLACALANGHHETASKICTTTEVAVAANRGGSGTLRCTYTISEHWYTH